MKHNMTHEEREDLYHWYNEAKDGKISTIFVTCQNSLDADFTQWEPHDPVSFSTVNGISNELFCSLIMICL